MKNKRYINYIAFFAVIGFIALRCTAPKQGYSSKENLYKKNNQELNAQFVAYHINDSLTQLFFKLPNENLIYKKPDTTVNFYAACKIKFFTYAASGKQLIDSGSVLIFDRQSQDVFYKNIFGSMYSKIKSGTNYISDIFVYDLNKKTKSAYVLNIDKNTSFSRQNFLVADANNNVMFDYYIKAGTDVFIKTEYNPEKKLAVDCFNREFPLAPPPFSTIERSSFNYKPDSSFIIVPTEGYYKLKIPQHGFYHIIAEPESKTGLTLFSVDVSFPGLKNETEMIRSTRFIMSKKEYDACLNATNKKLAIDEFWLDIGGSNERAKELLKKYYTRVSEANKLFTSHQMGWQTDRGMIFVIFGAPTNMHKNSDGEAWVYGNEAQPNAIRFNFKKVINPFSDNDFILERSEYYKETWYNAVDHWRQGHIYLDN